jgi:hypothetical protein
MTPNESKNEIITFFKHEITYILVVLVALGLCLYALAHVNSEMARVSNYYEGFIRDNCICGGPAPHFNFTTTGTIPRWDNET